MMNLNNLDNCCSEADYEKRITFSGKRENNKEWKYNF